MLEEIFTTKQIKGVRGKEVPWERKKMSNGKGNKRSCCRGAEALDMRKGREGTRLSAPTNLSSRCHHAALEDKGVVWIRCSFLPAAPHRVPHHAPHHGHD
jgi:hypothetical protein